MKDFLKQSPVAESVRLEGRIILDRPVLSSRELAGQGAFARIFRDPSGNEEAELEINGLSVASGSIVKKGGKYYFRVGRMYGEEKK